MSSTLNSFLMSSLRVWFVSLQPTTIHRNIFSATPSLPLSFKIFFNDRGSNPESVAFRSRIKTMHHPSTRIHFSLEIYIFFIYVHSFYIFLCLKFYVSPCYLLFILSMLLIPVSVSVSLSHSSCYFLRPGISKYSLSSSSRWATFHFFYLASWNINTIINLAF